MTGSYADVLGWSWVESLMDPIKAPEESALLLVYNVSQTVSTKCTVENVRRLYYVSTRMYCLAVLGVPRVRLSPYVFVTVLKRWWGTTRYLYAAWCPTRAAVVLRPTAG